MDVSEILQGLNERQREAVTHPARAMRVIAGAGSGKTRVLVQRMQWLMAVEGVSPYGLLALTFTNKAAREMRQRLEAALQRPLGQLWMGTFHGICHRILRRHAPLMQWPEQFVIMDSDDQLRLVKRMMRARQWDEAVMKPKNMVWQINAKTCRRRRIRGSWPSASSTTTTKNFAASRARWILPNCCC